MIGLFLGDTDFSEIVLKKIKKQNIKYFIIDFSKYNKFKKDKHSYKISIGRFGTIINLIKQKKYMTSYIELEEDRHFQTDWDILNINWENFFLNILFQKNSCYL